MTKDIDQEINQLSELVSRALKKAKDKGADQVYLSVGRASTSSISCRKQNKEKIKYSNSMGISIVLYKDQAMGSSQTNELSDGAIEKCIDAALSIAKYTDPDDAEGLPEYDLLAKESKDFDVYHPQQMDMDKAFEICKSLEQQTLVADRDIDNFQSSSFGWGEKVRVVGNSHDIIFSKKLTTYTKSVHLIMKGNDDKSKHGYSSTYEADLKDLLEDDFIINEAIEEAKTALNPRKVKTGTYPVIFKRGESDFLFSSFYAAITGGSQYYKTGYLQDCKGNEVFPSWLSIDENPFVMKDLGSSFMDGDMVKRDKFCIVKDGVVQDYLLSNYYAKKLKLITNGHSGGVTNTYVKSSIDNVCSYTDLVKKMDKGLIITSTIGQGFNHQTGDYSSGAEGFWVENGEIQYPVSGFTIAGNILDMYRNIVAIGSDIDARTDVNVGSVLLSSMKIAGE